MVRVQHHALRLSLRHGRVERIQHQLGPQMHCHRPADDLAAQDVDDDGEIEKANPGRDVHDVGDPELIRGDRGKVALDEVRCRLGGAVAHGRHAELATANAGDTRLTHEPRHPLEIDDATVYVRQLRPDPRRSIGAVGHLVDRLDPLDKGDLVGGPPRGRSLAPGVKARLGNAERAAADRGTMAGLIRPHESERVLRARAASSWANQAAAFFRMSRSSRRRAFSRRSWESSWRSSVVSPSLRRPECDRPDGPRNGSSSP